MRITLELVRGVLRHALGRDSYIASMIKHVDESSNCPTACITADGHMQYGPTFVQQYIACEEDVFSLVMHELMHPLYSHWIHGSGELENIAADMVINATISQLFANASGEGSLFKRFYESHGIHGLLRPMSCMRDSRYEDLYDAFYTRARSRDRWLSTGEVIQTLKILTPTIKVDTIVLLGTHGVGTAEQTGNKSKGFAAEVLGKIADELKNAVNRLPRTNAGYSENLYEMFVETLKIHLSIKKALLQKFATRQKMDNFQHDTRHARIQVSPIPLRPSKRDLVLMSAGMTLFHYHNQTAGITQTRQGLAIYLDVSGSVNQHLPHIVSVLECLRAELKTIYLFSNKVVEIPFKTLLAGNVQTTYGTDFNCIAHSILEQGYDKAVIITDGYAAIDPDLVQMLVDDKVNTFTVLFGGKQECPEFARTGDIVQLEDIVH
jgi:hypothetical protein